MKRFVSVVFAIMVLFTVAFSKAELSNMSEAELLEVISKARNELLIRTAKAEEKVFIVDDDNISIYFTGKWTQGSGYHNDVIREYFKPELVVVNKTDRKFGVFFDHVAVNGWELGYVSGFYDIGAGNKKKEGIQIFFEDIDIEEYAEIEDFDIAFHLTDDNLNVFARYNDLKTIIDNRMWE